MSLPYDIERNTDAIRREVEGMGAELLEIVFRRSPGRSQLVLTADKTGGISLDDCAEINRRVGFLLDALAREGSVDTVLHSPYDLEVESPGLDRPLKNERDFSRAVGDRVKVAFRRDDGSSATWSGRLVSAHAAALELCLKDGSVKTIGYESVLHASREIEFGKSRHQKK